MMRCVIFCAAAFDSLEQPIGKEDLVIAADGGLLHTEALGIVPDEILGDFDSLGYIPEHSRVHPVEKDDTDMMLAIKLGMERGCREFLLYGAMDGQRLDHTVANYQALAYLANRGAWGYLIGNDYVATCVKNGGIAFDAGTEGTVSVFALGGKAEGISLKGLGYSMENGALSPDFPLGVSNHFTGAAASIRVEDGMLLCLWDRKNGLGRRV